MDNRNLTTHARAHKERPLTDRPLGIGLPKPGRWGVALIEALATGILVWSLAGCGGGGGDGGDASPPPASAPLSPGESAYNDPIAYSSAGSASLAGAEEAAAVTRHDITLGGTRINYTARAGHLIARHPTTAAAQASMFYVAYTADAPNSANGAQITARPVTFFYNGGPGSASVWLHLGSFGPRRLDTGMPGTTQPRPFALVTNNESLLDTTDLVFVNAVGTGLSQAIAPFSNSSFWGVDADAALFRDFIQRWLAVNGRAASPKFLFGESYGGPRTAVLARLMQEAGVMLSGLVLQSPAMDYNSNCGVIGAGNCAPYLPTYAAIGAWHGLASLNPGSGTKAADIDSYMVTLRGFTASRYAPAVQAFQAGHAPPADLPPLLADYTGLTSLPTWQTQFNMRPGIYAGGLFANDLIGRYDGRVRVPRGSPLAAEGDPSSTLISASFSSGIAGYLRNTLRYGTSSTYVMLGNAISSWDFSHAGRALPDTLPDLQAALDQNPQLRVLAASGYHDLATPFHLTELDLQRLNAAGRVFVRNYPGGHMSYLDDAARVRQKADLAAFYAGTLAVAAGQAQTPLTTRLAASALRPGSDRAGSPPVLPPVVSPSVQSEAPVQTLRVEPWAPPDQVQRALREQASSATQPPR
jgi:carboxypeptidase C (cathepsin A)